MMEDNMRKRMYTYNVYIHMTGHFVVQHKLDNIVNQLHFEFKKVSVTWYFFNKFYSFHNN